MKCNCEMWKDNYPMLENITMISSIHGVKWTGEFFKFCPWCGKAGVPSPHAPDKACGHTEENYMKGGQYCKDCGFDIHPPRR